MSAVFQIEQLRARRTQDRRDRFHNLVAKMGREDLSPAEVIELDELCVGLGVSLSKVETIIGRLREYYSLPKGTVAAYEKKRREVDAAHKAWMDFEAEHDRLIKEVWARSTGRHPERDHADLASIESDRRYDRERLKCKYYQLKSELAPLVEVDTRRSEIRAEVGQYITEDEAAEAFTSKKAEGSNRVV